MQQLEGQTARPGLGLHPAAERMNLRTLHSWCWATALCSLLLGQRACPAQQAAVHCPVLRSRQYPPGAPSPRHTQRQCRPSHAPNTQSPTNVLHTGPTWREMSVGFLQVNRLAARAAGTGCSIQASSCRRGGWAGTFNHWQQAHCDAPSLYSAASQPQAPPAGL